MTTSVLFGGGGGGTGTSLSGEVDTFADLPVASTATDEIWIVLQTTGVVFVNRKRSGHYLSDGTTWTRLAENESFTRTAATSGTDNKLIKSDGTDGNGTQESGVTVDDSDNITVPGTVNGRFIATDGTKLDGVENNATSDQTITLTGDVTGSGTGSFATVLANSGVTAATYGSSIRVPVFSVNAKGLITGVTNTNITFPSTPSWATVLSQGSTSGGINPRLTTTDRLEVRDAAMYIHSPADGELEIVADVKVTLTSPTVDIADGFQLDLPAAGAHAVAFEVNTASAPGIRFDRPTTNTGSVTIVNTNVAYHTFGALGTVLGDVEHTDGTNSMTYDASLNVLGVSGNRGGIDNAVMTTTEKNLTTPVKGRVIFDDTLGKLQCWDGSTWNNLH